ncbi:MAG: ATP-binding protein [Desulfatitalea sp.]
MKTLEQFQWNRPKKIDRLAVQNLFRLNFIHEKSNVILLGGVGLGKTYLASALGYQSIRLGPICSSRFSAGVMSKALRSTPPLAGGS